MADQQSKCGTAGAVAAAQSGFGAQSRLSAQQNATAAASESARQPAPAVSPTLDATGRKGGGVCGLAGQGDQLSLLEEIAALGRTSHDANTRRTLALNEWALLASPLNVGDDTIGQGYTFYGKRVRVTKIEGRLRFSGANPSVKVSAVVLKADGSPGKFETSWYLRGAA